MMHLTRTAGRFFPSSSSFPPSLPSSLPLPVSITSSSVPFKSVSFHFFCLVLFLNLTHLDPRPLPSPRLNESSGCQCRVIFALEKAEIKISDYKGGESGGGITTFFFFPHIASQTELHVGHIQKCTCQIVYSSSSHTFCVCCVTRSLADTELCG